jgi:DNA-binding NtrC family response regulator
VREGRFREDLFYRLNVVTITLPPLRERREDIPALAEAFLARYAAETKKAVRGATPEALALLAAQAWPGNVRELANVIERAVVLCAADRVGPEDLGLPASAARPAPSPAAGPPAAVGEFHGQVKAYKQALVQAALRQAAGNQTKAAELLGINRTYLVKLLRALEVRDATTSER